MSALPEQQLDLWTTSRHFSHLAVETDCDLVQRFADCPEHLWYAIRVVGDYRAYLMAELTISESALNRLLLTSDRLSDLSH
jgi:hypothetical protein